MNGKLKAVKTNLAIAGPDKKFSRASVYPGVSKARTAQANAGLVNCPRSRRRGEGTYQRQPALAELKPRPGDSYPKRGPWPCRSRFVPPRATSASGENDPTSAAVAAGRAATVSWFLDHEPGCEPLFSANTSHKPRPDWPRWLARLGHEA